MLTTGIKRPRILTEGIENAAGILILKRSEQRYHQLSTAWQVGNGESIHGAAALPRICASGRRPDDYGNRLGCRLTTKHRLRADHRYRCLRSHDTAGISTGTYSEHGIRQFATTVAELPSLQMKSEDHFYDSFEI